MLIFIFQTQYRIFILKRDFMPLNHIFERVLISTLNTLVANALIELLSSLTVLDNAPRHQLNLW